MAIIQNLPCPACQETGHDSTGDHLIVFEDGGKYCSRGHFHKSGEPLYVAPDGKDPVLDTEIDGKIKYSPAQFEELLDSGKLDNPLVRAVALGGMRQKDAYQVMTTSEKAVLHADWQADLDYFEKLKVKNLVTRSISGHIAKLYNVRAGVNSKGAVERHYYPRYDLEGNLIGAKCRTLPKDFSRGTLGRVWGECSLFGENTAQAVADSGGRVDTLVLTGGELDALAAQQMLVESQKGTKYEGKLFHVWSVNKGEQCIEELLLRKQKISQFKKLVLAFDEDEVGKKLTRDVARLFRSVKGLHVFKMNLPCKDPNACLMEGRAKEFVDAFWNPVDPFEGTHGALKSVAQLAKRAKVMPTMGKSWFLEGLNRLTFGISPHRLFVFGAGTGVGKTETTKSIVFDLMEQHDEKAAVIYLEEQPERTVRTFAGKLINKELENPPINDTSDPDYTEAVDYTEDEANAAIDALDRMDKLIIVETEGRKDIDYIIEIMDELLAQGIKYIVLDNLTAIELPKNSNKVEAIDEAMKRLGTFKDEKPVTIFLLAHLKRPSGDRTPHEEGGEVSINDFRGAGSITFWADGVFGIERNTIAPTDEAKRITTYRIVKMRQRAMSVGKIVRAVKDVISGHFREITSPNQNQSFDYGGGSKKKEEPPKQADSNEEF